MIKEGASDIVHDVFLKAWEKRAQCKDRTLAGFQNWLIGIVRNLVRDKYAYWRREIRNIELEQPIANGSKGDRELAGKAASSGRQRSIDRLWQAMNQLPEDQREAVRLQKLENWKIAEIADRMDCSTTAIQGRLRRGKKRLAELLNGGDSKIES